MSFQQYATPAERRIVRKMIKDALAKGWTISVFDGEEWALKRSRKEHDVLEALCSTDSDTLKFRDKLARPIGNVMLVWGNDEDVISDHSDNEKMNAFMHNRY